MALIRPSLSDIIARMAADMKNAVTGATTLALRSVLFILVRVVGGAVHLVYGYVDNLVLQLFTSTAEGNYLDLQGAEVGIVRTAATKAAGTITCTGVALTNIPAGSELVSPDNVIYTTDAAAVIGGGGSVTVDVTALLSGEDGNENAGVILAFSTPIIGVDTEATIDADGISGGTDDESDDDYRGRILARKQATPHGGAAHDLIAWAKEIAGVTRVWVVEEYNGVGTVLVSFVRDNDASIYPDAAALAVVESHLIEHVDGFGNTVGIPVTMKPGLFVQAPTPLVVNMTMRISPNTAAVRAAIQAELEDLFYEKAGPGQTIYVSNIDQAISRANGLSHHSLSLPLYDVTAAADYLHILGTLTFEDY